MSSGRWSGWLHPLPDEKAATMNARKHLNRITIISLEDAGARRAPVGETGVPGHRGQGGESGADERGRKKNEWIVQRGWCCPGFLPGSRVSDAKEHFVGEIMERKKGRQPSRRGALAGVARIRGGGGGKGGRRWGL